MHALRAYRGTRAHRSCASCHADWAVAPCPGGRCGLCASWTNIATARDGVRGSSCRVGRARLTLSTPSPGEPAWGRLAGTYPYDSKQSNPAVPCATRLQLRCNPGTPGNVRTRYRTLRKPAACRVKDECNARACRRTFRTAAHVTPALLQHLCRSLRLLEFPFFSIDCMSAGPMEPPPV